MRPVRMCRQATPSPARQRPGARSARPPRCLPILTQTGSLGEDRIMLFSKLFRRLRRPEPATRSAPRRSFVPRCEVLEDRTVPSFAGPTELLGVPPGGALVKVADFNNDSRPDIVTANGSNL